MNARTIIIGIIALAMAGGTAMLLKGYLKSQRQSAQMVSAKGPAPKPPPEMQILVAAKNLPAGHLIKPGDLSWRAWPKRGRMPAYIVKAKPPRAGKKIPANRPPNAKANPLQATMGAVVRFGIAAGEPIVAGRVVKPGDRGFMAAVLTPGMRAVSVPITATSGVAGFMFPGDRVDLIVTHSVKMFGVKVKASRVSETVLTGIRVLAVDQRVDDQKTKPSIGKTATLEVTPKQAEIIAVAVQIGQVTLSLRSLAGPVKSARRGRTYTRDSEVSRFLRNGIPQRKGRKRSFVRSLPLPFEPPSDGKSEVYVLRGGKATTEKFGGDSAK